MGRQKMLEVVTVYRRYFEKNSIPKSSFPHDQLLSQYNHHANELALSHCHGMLDKVEEFILFREDWKRLFGGSVLFRESCGCQAVLLWKT